jgi:hypothetical protein
VGPTGGMAAAANCRAHHARGGRGTGRARREGGGRDGPRNGGRGEGRSWAALGSWPRGEMGVFFIFFFFF